MVYLVPVIPSRHRWLDGACNASALGLLNACGAGSWIRGDYVVLDFSRSNCLLEQSDGLVQERPSDSLGFAVACGPPYIWIIS